MEKTLKVTDQEAQRLAAAVVEVERWPVMTGRRDERGKFQAPPIIHGIAIEDIPNGQAGDVAMATRSSASGDYDTDDYDTDDYGGTSQPTASDIILQDCFNLGGGVYIGDRVLVCSAVDRGFGGQSRYIIPLRESAVIGQTTGTLANNANGTADVMGWDGSNESTSVPMPGITLDIRNVSGAEIPSGSKVVLIPVTMDGATETMWYAVRDSTGEGGGSDTKRRKLVGRRGTTSLASSYNEFNISLDDEYWTVLQFSQLDQEGAGFAGLNEDDQADHYLEITEAGDYWIGFGIEGYALYYSIVPWQQYRCEVRREPSGGADETLRDGHLSYGSPIDMNATESAVTHNFEISRPAAEIHTLAVGDKIRLRWKITDMIEMTTNFTDNIDFVGETFDQGFYSASRAADGAYGHNLREWWIELIKVES